MESTEVETGSGQVEGSEDEEEKGESRRQQQHQSSGDDVPTCSSSDEQNTDRPARSINLARHMTVVRRKLRPQSRRQQQPRAYLGYDQSAQSKEEGFQLQEAVKLPADQRLDDWVAIHIQDFAHRAHLLNNLVVNSGKCNSQTCPDFRAGPIQYLWQDGEGFKVPTSIPAPDYITHLFEWISQCSANLTLTESLSRKIFTRMFRVFVHVYYDHFETLRHLEAERHTSSFLLHFYFFVTEFDLVAKSQFEPLQILIDKLCEDL